MSRPFCHVLALMVCLAGVTGGCVTMSDVDTSRSSVDASRGQSGHTTADEPTVSSTDVASTTQPDATDIADTTVDDSFPTDNRVSRDVREDHQRLVDVQPAPVFSFRAQGIPLADALRLFSRMHNLNIVVGPGIDGMVTVEFHDLDLGKAMAALLDVHGYYWEQDGTMILIRRLETRTFTLDYIRLERSGVSRNKAQITSGSGRGGGQDAGEMVLSQQDHIKFWEEIESQLNTLLSDEGRFVVNRLSGTIQITDLHRRVEDVEMFLDTIRDALYRQVEIRARIYEVTLRDDYSLGLNWDRIALGSPAGNFNLSNIITSPAGGFIARSATAAFNFRDGDFEGVIAALEEQGTVKVVSQPRILTMNNQPALIKVGTDRSFFSSITSRGTAGTGDIVTEQVRTVTVGLVLSVTPQISSDGWIIMDVSPIITRLADTVESPQKLSTAPVLDVKQSGGLVRVRHGEMVVVGGLIQDRETDTRRKVPILGDIPWLGRLFQGTYQATEKTELIIFLTPRIVDAT